MEGDHQAPNRSLKLNAVENMLRVLIIEDNPIFLEAFKTALQERPPFVVIEEAGNGEGRPCKESRRHLLISSLQICVWAE